MNKYLLNEKLHNGIETQRKNIEVVQKVLAQRNTTKSDIERLRGEIDRINNEIMGLTKQRDQKNETNEDKIVVYRHQVYF